MVQLARGMVILKFIPVAEMERGVQGHPTTIPQSPRSFGVPEVDGQRVLQT